jgi:hypothetical protein
MQVAGRESWRMACGEPRLLLLALYVRDAAGIGAVADPPVPRLDPPVPRAAEAAPPAASAQWTAWWRRLLVSEPEVGRAVEAAGGGQASLRALASYRRRFIPPDFEGLRESPELRDLVARHHAAADAWIEARARESFARSAARGGSRVEWEAVRDAERRLGRRARPFRLQVSVLPVLGDHCWRVGDEHLLVTRARHWAPDAWRRDLQPVVDELARNG